MQEDINVTSEVGRQHILGQSLLEKKGLLRAWILRDHRPTGVSVSSFPLPLPPARLLAEAAVCRGRVVETADPRQRD